jgi:hypothetical protein
MRLAGVECFEGLDMTGDDDADRTKVDRWIHAVHTVARQCDAEKLYGTSEVTLTAGGSAVFDLVARALPMSLSRPVRAILRSGCYLTHDSGMYTRFARTMRSRNDATWREGDGLKLRAGDLDARAVTARAGARDPCVRQARCFVRHRSPVPLARVRNGEPRVSARCGIPHRQAQRPARVHGSAGGRRRARG